MPPASNSLVAFDSCTPGKHTRLMLVRWLDLLCLQVLCIGDAGSSRLPTTTRTHQMSQHFDHCTQVRKHIIYSEYCSLTMRHFRWRQPVGPSAIYRVRRHLSMPYRSILSTLITIFANNAISRAHVKLAIIRSPFAGTIVAVY
jgi:hypothetical protein